MIANRKVTGRAFSIPAGLAAAAGVSILVTLIGVAIVAYLLDRQVIQESAIGYGSMAILFLASAAGAITAALTIKHQLLLMCLLSGVCYYAVLLGITALFFGGQYQGMGVTALVVLAGCAAVALILAKGMGISKKRTRKRAYR